MSRPVSRAKHVIRLPHTLCHELREAGVQGALEVVSAEGLSAHTRRPVHLLRRGWVLRPGKPGEPPVYSVGTRAVGQGLEVDYDNRVIRLETRLRGCLHRVMVSMSGSVLASGWVLPSPDRGQQPPHGQQDRDKQDAGHEPHGHHEHRLDKSAQHLGQVIGL
jgi:hypothetical protein